MKSVERVAESEQLERATALKELAWAYYDNRQYLYSIAAYEEAFYRFQVQGKPADAAECYRMQAVVLAHIGRHRSAMRVVGEAQEIFQEEGDFVGVASTRILLGARNGRGYRLLQSSNRRDARTARRFRARAR